MGSSALSRHRKHPLNVSLHDFTQRAAVTIADTTCRFFLKSFVPHSPHDHSAWPRDYCHIVQGAHSIDIPTELAVVAQCNRLTRLTQVSDQRLQQGFDRAHPPPAPVDTVAFRAEWLAQEHFDRIGHSGDYYLSHHAWDHDIPILMPQETYVEASNHLLTVASTSIVHIAGREVNLLVDSTAEREHAEGRYPGTSREKVQADMAMLRNSWTIVLVLVAEYFRARLLFFLLNGEGTLTTWTSYSARTSPPIQACSKSAHGVDARMDAEDVYLSGRL